MIASAATAIMTVLACVLIAGLGFVPEPDSSWGARWEALAAPPSYYQREALTALSRTVFLVASGCAAVAALSLLVHAVSRLIAGWKALAIRSALGAGYRDLVRSIAPELAALTLFGAACGALSGVAALVVQASALPALLVQAQRGVAWLLLPAALCALGVLLAAVVLPLILVLHCGRRLTGELVGETATSAAGQLRLQHALATIQLAALLVVTYGGALVLRASPLTAPREVILDTSDAAVLPLRFETAATPAQRSAAYAELVERLHAEAGPSAALSSPGAWLGFGKSLEVVAICGSCFVGQNFSPLNYGHGRAVAVGPGALTSMGVQLRSGRMLDARDDFTAARVVVISAQAAREMFPRGDPLGQIIRTGLQQGDDYTVVGIVNDLAPRGLGASGKPLATIYFSLLQHPPEAAELAIPAAAPASLRTRLRFAPPPNRPAAYPPIVLGPAARLIDRLRRFGEPLHWFARLFAVLTVLGAGLSLYAFGAVMMQLVIIKRRDIAIRLAIGARPWHVVRWITGRGAIIALYGVLVGATGARFTGDVIRRSLSKSDEGDVVVLLVLVMAFALIGIAASFVPGMQASRTDPAAIWREKT